MGLYKDIKSYMPPDAIEASSNLEDIMRDIADRNDSFENLLVEYGIKCFIRKLLLKEG